VKGPWREGSLVGDPGGEVERTLEKGVCFHRDHVGKPGRMLIYREL
jgi:hypothetical protein